MFMRRTLLIHHRLSIWFAYLRRYAADSPWRKYIQLPQHFRGRQAFKVNEKNLKLDWSSSESAPVFTLQDGPPYANGDVHLGHFVNKVYKDVIMRHQILKGNKVIHKPGWDCHGLPIEIAALKMIPSSERTPPKIISECLSTASSTVNNHISEMKEWNLLPSFDKNKIYLTNSPGYISSQLQCFDQLWKSGLFKRKLVPIYWSVSSKTALAESELTYDDNHISLSCEVGFKLNSEFTEKILEHAGVPLGQDVSILIWTTTPWSLPANEAVAFSSTAEYWLVEIIDKNKLIICTKDVKLDHANLKFISQIPHSLLERATYNHPIMEGKSCPIFHSEHVKLETGTGLVHIAPSHGHTDFKLVDAFKENYGFVMPVHSFIDDMGRFTKDVPMWLQDSDAMTKGQTHILNHLKTTDALISENASFRHSYPYDWRTGKPVMIRTSLQWMFDLAKPVFSGKSVIDLSLQAVQDLPIHSPGSGLENSFKDMISGRSEWCISRQRVWGVPIPCLYHKDRPDDAIVSSKFTLGLADLVEKEGSLDFWWKWPENKIIETLMGGQLEGALGDYRLGRDIMDVWLDSGLAWYASGTCKDDAPADVYCEGLDQFRGWFVSSLLTKVGVTGLPAAPFKSLFVHGFVTDKNGGKMSKSIGNVVSPREVIGDDRLHASRLWALRGANLPRITFSPHLIEQEHVFVRKIRALTSFANMSRYNLVISPIDLSKDVTHFLQLPEASSLPFQDRYFHSVIHEFWDKHIEAMDNYQFQPALRRIERFAFHWLSAVFIDSLKPRLYLEPTSSFSRISAEVVVVKAALALINSVHPFCPGLSEEIISRFEPYKTTCRAIYPEFLTSPFPIHLSDEEKTFMQSLQQVKAQFHSTVDKNPSMYRVTLNSNARLPSEWLDLVHHTLGCSLVAVVPRDDVTPNEVWFEGVENISVKHTKCTRCRLYNISPDVDVDPKDCLCDKCAEQVNIMKGIVVMPPIKSNVGI